MAFADLKDQQQVVELLQRSLERGRLAHAYLFTGNSLAALESMAATLAKTLNCAAPSRTSASGIALDCCDRCLNCRRIAEAVHPDVFWVRPESKLRVITIDQMRQLMQTVHLKPTEARFKVAVIVAADRLNSQAANAFLKTLEEPPPNSVIVLLSTEPQRVLETILSRCLRLSFAGESASDPELLGWLKEFAQAAAGDQSSLLNRYRLLGILLKRLGQIRANVEAALQSNSPLQKYEDIESSLKEKWEDELSAAVEAEYRHQRSGLLRGLQLWLRDVWLHSLAVKNRRLHFPDLSAATALVSKRLSADNAMENLLLIDRVLRMLESNIQEALALEVTFLKLKV